MPEYGVAREPFQPAQDAPTMQKALYGILNMLYGSDAIQDAPLDMMMPLGGMAKQGLKAGKKAVSRANRGLGTGIPYPATLHKGGRPGPAGPMVNGEYLKQARPEPISPTAVSPHEIRQLIPEWALSEERARKPWNKP
jgi:hypothetical protein